MIRDGAIENAPFGPMNVVSNDTLIVRKDLPMIIDSPPRFVQAFVQPVRSGLSKPQFHHVWTLVLGILLNVDSFVITAVSEESPPLAIAPGLLFRAVWAFYE